MKYEDGHIKINLHDLIGELANTQRAEIIDALACRNEVIDEVANQIIDGWTTLSSHAGRTYGGDAEATRGIDGARMRIAKASSEIAAEEIAALAKQVEREKALGAKGWEAYHQLLDSRRFT